MKFRTRIVGLPVIAAAIFLAGAITSWLAGAKTQAELAILSTQAYPAKTALDDLAFRLTHFRATVQSAAAEGEQASLDEAKQVATVARKDIELVAAIPGWAETGTALREALITYEPAAIEAALVMSGKSGSEGSLERMQSASKVLDERLQHAQNEANAAVELAQEESHHGVAQMLLVLLATGVTILFGLAVASFFLLRSVWRDLGDEPEALRQRMRRLAEGDLSNQALPSGVPAGSLLDAMETTRCKLSRIVNDIRMASENIRVAASEVAAGNLDLSDRTERASIDLQQTASNTERITTTVAHTAQSAQTASKVAGEARSAAADGERVVVQAVQHMHEISNASIRIEEIIGVIDGIAFQTNILALNAAVEAARAGEQGRGFAVVAGEVRALAQRSAQAAREIKTLITTSSETVQAGSRCVGEAGESMQKLLSQVTRVAGIIEEIASAAGEQSSGMSEVNQAVLRLDSMTQQNAALVEQSSAAATSLREQAAGLNESVATFRVNRPGFCGGQLV